MGEPSGSSGGRNVNKKQLKKRSIGKVPGHYRSRNAKETRFHTSTTPRQVRQYKQSRANERGQIQRNEDAAQNVQGKQRRVQQETRFE